MKIANTTDNGRHGDGQAMLSGVSGPEQMS